MSRRERLIIGVFGVGGLILFWDGLGRVGVLDQDLFPSSLVILKRFVELSLSPEFLSRHVGGSLVRLLFAGTAALPLAILCGVWLGLSARAHAALNPFINFTLPLPKVAIFPLILAVFGIGDLGKIILIAIGLFYPLFINVLHGTIRLRHSDYMDLVRIYQIRRTALWLDIYGLGLINDILVGSKASIGYGFTLIVVSEFSASTNGLGHYIWRSWDAFQIVDMYAGVLWLCLLGWLVQLALDHLLSRNVK
ncbi:MAG: ABC transporter permease [Pseudobdellovibrionaceae bacterium]